MKYIPSEITINLAYWIEPSFIEPVEKHLGREITEQELADILSYAVGYGAFEGERGERLMKDTLDVCGITK